MYRAGSVLASAVPDSILFPAAKFTGTAVGRIDARRRDVVRRNLARVVPANQIDACVDEAFRSYARYWMEALRLPKPGLREIARRTTSEGIEPMAKVLNEGRGVIFVTPHLGNWDVAAAWLASQGWKTIAVAEELEPPELYELFVRLRASIGIEVHPLGRGASARALLSGLRQGAVAGLVADRDISGSGVEVEFFGENTFLPSGPAVLALRTGAPLAAGAMYHRPGGRYHAVALDPIPVEQGRATPEVVQELTQLMARDFETLIRREPGQWHLFQPNWPSDPGYRR
jgi:KDO2-lipid IV(A) lauroyltransferase